MEQYKYHIGFLSETNDRLVMTNIRLREYLDDINTRYQELIAVSKEELKRKRETQSQAEGLNQKIRSLSQQNELLLKNIKSLEIEQDQSKKQSHALEGIAILAEAANNL